jgi:hypothetical protein
MEWGHKKEYIVETWNRYAYVANNPLNHVDKNGLILCGDDDDDDDCDGDDDGGGGGDDGGGQVQPPPDVTNLPLSNQPNFSDLTPTVVPPGWPGDGYPVSVQPVFQNWAFGWAIQFGDSNQYGMFNGGAYQMQFITEDGSVSAESFQVSQNITVPGMAQDLGAVSTFTQGSTDLIGQVYPYTPGWNVQQLTYTVTSPTGAFNPYNLTTVINQYVWSGGGIVALGYPNVVQKHQRPFGIRRVARRNWSPRRRWPLH